VFSFLLPRKRAGFWVIFSKKFSVVLKNRGITVPGGGVDSTTEMYGEQG